MVGLTMSNDKKNWDLFLEKPRFCQTWGERWALRIKAGVRAERDPLPTPAHLQVRGQKQLWAALACISSRAAAAGAVWALVRC